MKLTGGHSRGRRLRPPRADGLRPTAARVREALFDILGARVRAVEFLDLYAGTGAVGIEALSRGARRAVFVENAPDAVRLITANLAVGAWEHASEVIAAPVAAALDGLARRRARFGIAFADPPYDQAAPEDVVAAAWSVLEPGAVLVFEHRTGLEVRPPEGTGFRSGRVYRYGDTTLTLLHRDPGQSPR